MFVILNYTIPKKNNIMPRKKNPKIKTPDQEEEYTYDQVVELKRCMSDPIYFIEKYIKIQHPVQGAIHFKLYDYQKKMISTYENNKSVIVLSARQTGKCNLNITRINTITKPTFFKKWILYILNRSLYNECYKSKL